MRLSLACLFATLASVVAFAQTLGPKPSTLQHISIDASVSAQAVPRGGTVTLWADVTPKPNIHVYASNKDGFTPVTLVLTPQAGLTIGKVKYPHPELLPTPGVSDRVPVYHKVFRLAEPVTVAATAKSGEDITIAGVVNYQACDDRVCYPTASLPISWTVRVK
jgi:DsbC/DsbD-like thiol-disulfide interchange protein